MDDIWEQIYSSRSWGKYPSENLIKRAMRAFKTPESRRQAKVLELGCGAGANLSLFVNEGFQTYGLDGAPSALRQARELLANKVSSEQTFELIESTFEEYQFPANEYDLIVDCLAISTNTFSTIQETYEKARSSLNKGGYLYSHVWGLKTEGADTGEIIEQGTSKNPAAGPSENLGTTHFFSLEEIKKLFSAWSHVEIANQLTTYADEPQRKIEEWIIWATK